ncbi:MAG: RNA methyltransferase [Ignavibacteriales bacterium]|nr:RNA methyltransferase [Ignavibacteriales bacterium]
MRISKSELKYLRSLSQKKTRQTEKRFILEGWRALKEAVNSSVRIDLVGALSRYLEDGDYAGILGEAKKRNVPIKELSETELGQISETVHAQGVIAVVHQANVTLSDRLIANARTVVAADAVNDPGNLGSLIRTADWFGVDLLLLGKGCVELYNDKVVRSTVGSLFHVSAVEGVELPVALGDLKRQGFEIVALSADGRSEYSQIRRDGKMVLVVGSEAHGVSKGVKSSADVIVRIPRFGRAESLNVSVACGIVMAHVKMR